MSASSRKRGPHGIGCGGVQVGGCVGKCRTRQALVRNAAFVSSERSLSSCVHLDCNMYAPGMGAHSIFHALKGLFGSPKTYKLDYEDYPFALVHQRVDLATASHPDYPSGPETSKGSHFCALVFVCRGAPWF
jgi:hypothetical protein